MRYWMIAAAVCAVTARGANAATTITLNNSGQNNGMTFFGGGSQNVNPTDLTNIYVQINSNAQGAQMPSGFGPANLPQFSSTSSAGNYTFDWVSGGYPAPTPFGNINAAFKLFESGSTSSAYVFNVINPSTAALITLAFTSGVQKNLQGTLAFYRFEQAKNPINGQDNLPITAFAHFTPTADPHGFGAGDLVLTFNDTNNRLVGVRGNNGVISQQTFTGRLTSVGAVPEPASWALMLVGLGGIGMTMRRQRKPSSARARIRARVNTRVF